MLRLGRVRLHISYRNSILLPMYLLRSICKVWFGWRRLCCINPENWGRWTEISEKLVPIPHSPNFTCTTCRGWSDRSWCFFRPNGIVIYDHSPRDFANTVWICQRSGIEVRTTHKICFRMLGVGYHVFKIMAHLCGPILRVTHATRRRSWGIIEVAETVVGKCPTFAKSDRIAMSRNTSGVEIVPAMRIPILSVQVTFISGNAQFWGIVVVFESRLVTATNTHLSLRRILEIVDDTQTLRIETTHNRMSAPHEVPAHLPRAGLRLFWYTTVESFVRSATKIFWVLRCLSRFTGDRQVQKISKPCSFKYYVVDHVLKICSPPILFPELISYVKRKRQNSRYLRPVRVCREMSCMAVSRFFRLYKTPDFRPLH